ncbi:50S ribosomal protein L6 [Irregularibacter muris]|jgi:large subunit ribosomal protein L6|uniref:Large ribosomal subunit protein uL6 n=1 Tax=Irregularibacter muris TaxID=1796619 RepID=A0AAE3L3Q4_9FIRM|nr:50S ribosomal protein L6 [Irregularibacter muris]MCR1898653.1 50S ribosomal protein L6 [Irregularibacter muris]
MSRIGKLPIAIPEGVNAEIAGSTLTVKGPKGQLVKTFHKDMNIAIEDNEILVTRPSENKKHRSLHGLTRSLIDNMVNGVSKGFEKVLEINGVGYRAQKQGNKLVLSLGYSHPVEMVDPEGITVEVPANNKIIVKGIDKELVGLHAANIRKMREPEPYKGKGIKYENETIRRKEGKAGK